MSLEELNLWGDVFNSYILSSLGSLSNLKSLSLRDGCAMEGSIGLLALKNLEKLYLGCDNENDGFRLSVKKSILQLQSLDIFPSLKTLSLENISLKGTISRLPKNIYIRIFVQLI